MKNNSLALISAILSVIALLGIIWFITQTKKEKIVYVNNTELYENFKGKKLLEHKLQQNLEGQKNMIDSLQLVLTSINPEKEQKKYKQQVELFNNVNRSYQINLQEQRNTFIEQILNEINIYISDFGKENGYSIILGVNGSGNVVYGKEKIDVTKEAIQYINSKYENK